VASSADAHVLVSFDRGLQAPPADSLLVAVRWGRARPETLRDYRASCGIAGMMMVHGCIDNSVVQVSPETVTFHNLLLGRRDALPRAAF